MKATRRITLPKDKAQRKEAQQAARLKREEAERKEMERIANRTRDLEFMAQFIREEPDPIAPLFTNRPLAVEDTRRVDVSKLPLNLTYLHAGHLHSLTRPQLLRLIFELGYSPFLAAKYNDIALRKLAVKAMEQRNATPLDGI